MISEQVALTLIDALNANTAALLHHVSLPVVPVVPAAGATLTHGTSKIKRNAKKDFYGLAYQLVTKELPGIIPFVTPPKQ